MASKHSGIPLNQLGGEYASMMSNKDCTKEFKVLEEVENFAGNFKRYFLPIRFLTTHSFRFKPFITKKERSILKVL